MNRYSRRQVLRFGGVGVAGVVLAACGKQANVPESENVVSVGVTPSKVTLPNVEVNDIVLLRTAASLEYNAIDTYDAAIGLGVFNGAFMPAGEIAKRLRDDHKGHADAINGLIQGYERWVEAREGREERLRRGHWSAADRRQVNALAETRRLQRLLTGKAARARRS